MAYEPKPFEAFKIGDAVTFSKTIGAADISAFAGICGDVHPVHVDEAYARQTRFGGCIAQGMLTASLLSTTAGLILSTPGAILVSQDLRFKRPVRPGDTVTARSEIVELIPEQRRLRWKSTIVNQRGEIVVESESVGQKDPA
ncbi:MAG: MaoC family dehydratase [Candidatus Baltobacteraceae bacterium]